MRDTINETTTKIESSLRIMNQSVGFPRNSVEHIIRNGFYTERDRLSKNINKLPFKEVCISFPDRDDEYQVFIRREDVLKLIKEDL